MDGFEWDQNKSDRTLGERSFDFATAAKVFESDYLEQESTGRDYGEPRFKVIGVADGVLLAVVWTPRGANRRIISARRCRLKKGKPTVSSMQASSGDKTITMTNDEVRKHKGRIDAENLTEPTADDFKRWALEDDEPTEWGPARAVVAPGPDIRALRERLGLSQEQFAERFYLSARTVQQWEQGRRSPDGPTRLLLKVIEAMPDMVARIAASESVVVVEEKLPKQADNPNIRRGIL